jgi:predicted exporter
VPSRVIAFLIALPILVFIALWQANIKTDISAFFMTGDSMEVALIASNMQTSELSRRYLVSISDMQSGEKPIQIADLFRQRLAGLDGIERVWEEGLSETEIESLISFYLPYRYRLFSLSPESDVAAFFTSDTMNTRADTILEELLGPQGPWIKRILADDPMFVISHWLRHFSTIEDRPGRHVTMIIQSDAAGLDTAKQRPLREKIEQLFNEINTLNENRYQLEMTGVPIFAMAVQKQVEADVKRVSTISMVVMLLLFMLLFRSLAALTSVILTLLASATAATIITTLLFGEIHALTLGLGTTLIGICVDYPIHTMVHIAGGKGSAVESSRRIWPSLLLGAVTTIVGYSALTFTEYPGMQQIALYAGSGILTAVLLTRFILPAAIEKRAASMKPVISFSLWLNFAQSSKFRMLVLSAATLLLIGGLTNMNWQDDLSRLSPSLTSLKAKDQEIRSRIQSIEPGRFILVHAANLEQALQASEDTLRALKPLQERGDIDAIYSLYPWLASKQLQEKNSNAFSIHITPQMIESWFDILESRGFRREALTRPALTKIDVLNLDKVSLSPAHRFIAGQYLIDNKQVILTIWLGRHNGAAVRNALTGVENTQYVSQKEMINRMNDSYRSKAIEAMGYGALVILLLLALRFGSLIRALHTLFPAMVSVAIVVGGWGISGQPLGMLHLVGLLLAVAICVDYGIFFIENRAHDRGLTYQAIVVSALTTIAAFSSLGLAENPALKSLAWSIAPGVFFGFLLCPLLIRIKKEKELNLEVGT